MTSEQLALLAQNAEQSGFDNLWVPEMFGRDPFVTCATLLDATQTIQVGTAITNVYTRDERAIKPAAYSLAESSGHRYEATDLMFGHGGRKVLMYLAAYGPKLMQVAADRMDGAYVYMMPPEYSKQSKTRIGDGKLHLMQPTVFETDPDVARKHARRAVSIYMPLENYHRVNRKNNLPFSRLL